MKFKKSFLLALVAPLFLFANAAHATSLGSIDCNMVTGVQPALTGNVGDTITITASGGLCQVTLSHFTGNVTIVDPQTPGTYTASTTGLGGISWQQNAGPTGSVAVTIASGGGGSSSTPSLSQWAQILLALLAVGMMAWYYRKQRQTQ